MSAAETVIAVLGVLVGVLAHQLYRSRRRARALAVANRRLHREVFALRPRRRAGDRRPTGSTGWSRAADPATWPQGAPISPPAPFPAPHRDDCRCRSCTGRSASPAQVDGPADVGEVTTSRPAAGPVFGRLDVEPFPDDIRAGWVCPCGEGGYLLAGASQDDVAGYEADQFDHAEACPQSGAL